MDHFSCLAQQIQKLDASFCILLRQPGHCNFIEESNSARVSAFVMQTAHIAYLLAHPYHHQRLNQLSRQKKSKSVGLKTLCKFVSNLKGNPNCCKSRPPSLRKQLVVPFQKIAFAQQLGCLSCWRTVPLGLKILAAGRYSSPCRSFFGSGSFRKVGVDGLAAAVDRRLSTHSFHKLSKSAVKSTSSKPSSPPTASAQRSHNWL